MPACMAFWPDTTPAAAIVAATLQDVPDTLSPDEAAFLKAGKRALHLFEIIAAQFFCFAGGSYVSAYFRITLAEKSHYVSLYGAKGSYHGLDVPSRSHLSACRTTYSTASITGGPFAQTLIAMSCGSSSTM